MCKVNTRKSVIIPIQTASEPLASMLLSPSSLEFVCLIRLPLRALETASLNTVAVEPLRAML